MQKTLAATSGYMPKETSSNHMDIGSYTEKATAAVLAAVGVVMVGAMIPGTEDLSHLYRTTWRGFVVGGLLIAAAGYCWLEGSYSLIVRVVASVAFIVATPFFLLAGVFLSPESPTAAVAWMSVAGVAVLVVVASTGYDVYGWLRSR